VSGAEFRTPRPTRPRNRGAWQEPRRRSRRSQPRGTSRRNPGHT
jgi:hypothetical protein